MTFSIVIATYGSQEWLERGDAVERQVAGQADEVIRLHHPHLTVATARNGAARLAKSDYLVFVDGDDELAPGYIGAMRRALEQQRQPGNGADGPLLLAPAVQYVTAKGRSQRPKFWPQCDLRDGNWLVIGTAVPRDLFLQVGGFDDRPDYGGFEDWALWIKCAKAGAVPVKVPQAVYIANILPGSRHRDSTHEERVGWHYAVGHDHYPEVYNEAWLQWMLRGTRPQRAPRQRVARRR